jgi:hypothetical protein
MSDAFSAAQFPLAAMNRRRPTRDLTFFRKYHILNAVFLRRVDNTLLCRDWILNRREVRSGFFIHGGLDFNTKGCIDLQEGDKRFQNFFVSTKLSSIYVYVKYEQERVTIREKKPKVYTSSPYLFEI